MPLILGTNSIKDTGYNVANSANFESANSQALSKDYSGTHSDTNQGTWSMWIKRAKLATRMKIFGAYIDGNQSGQNLEFQANDTLRYRAGSGSSDINITDAVYRDPSAWYHIVVQQDSDASGASNQVKIWVNNTLQTLSTNNGAPGIIQFGHADAAANSIIGAEESAGNSTYFDGYMAEFAYCDGQKLDPTSFGEYDEDSPTIWKPKDLSGLTFGSQGVWLDFETSGTMGNDVSGNNNDFATEDNAVEQTTDTPTNNFCTMNPLDNYYAGSTFSEGNNKVVTAASPSGYNVSTIGLSAGKWYWEVEADSFSTGNDYCQIGISGSPTSAQWLGYNPYDWAMSNDSVLYNDETELDQSYSSAMSPGDIVSVALNLDDNEIKFYINGTVQNSGNATSITAAASTTLGAYFAAASDFSGSAANLVTTKWNFGGFSAFTVSSGNADDNGYGNFEYAPPSGFLAVCTKNLGSDGG